MSEKNYVSNIASSLSITKGAGRVTRIVVKDTSDGSSNIDASLSINIDGQGAYALDLNGLAANESSSIGGHQVDGMVFAPNGGTCAWVFSIPLYFRQSITITPSNHDACDIFYDLESAI